MRQTTLKFETAKKKNQALIDHFTKDVAAKKEALKAMDTKL